MRFQRGNKDSSRGWDRGHSYYPLAKTLTTFHPRPQILSKVELRSDGQTCLVKGISRQSSVGIAVTGYR